MGESDFVIICRGEEKDFAIFIEDKIAADPQPEQARRYKDRPETLSKEENFEKYYVFLCASKVYIGGAKEDRYDYSISHEEICEKLDENDINKQIFTFSCNEKKQGYTPIKNDCVTYFWQNLYAYVKENYHYLVLPETIGARGTNATWPSFKKCFKNIRIIWKSDIKWNCVDLEFSGFAGRKDELIKRLKGFDCTAYQPKPTGKSLSLRKTFPSSVRVSFSRSFHEQLDNIKAFLDSVAEFHELCLKCIIRAIIKSETKNSCKFKI